MQIRRLREDFGAEVLDFDPMRATPAGEVEALRDAYDEHQLLVFRGDRSLPPDRQVEISSWFGPPIANADGGQPWTVLHNDELVGRARLTFHSDLSYTEHPILGLSLHAIALPPGGSATAFVSGVRAWADLPSHRQAELGRMSLRHRLAKGRFGDWPEFVADHPVRLEHPRTGRPVLYVTEQHADRIYELEPEASAQVLAELFAHLYAPERIYVHRWRLYDLVIWDNLAIQHARPEAAEPAAGERALQRVSLARVPHFELVERARGQERERQAARDVARAPPPKRMCPAAEPASGFQSAAAFAAQATAGKPITNQN